MDVFNWGAISAGSTVVCAVAGLINWTQRQSVLLEIEKLKAHLSDTRQQDREETRAWINGSFMRAGQVEARLRSFEDKLELFASRGFFARIRGGSNKASGNDQLG